MKSYDLVVIGAGNAGQAAAGAARAAGRTVAIIEAREVGGVCPNRGCVPKKVLVAAATALDTVQRAGEHHIDVGTPSIDWAGIIAKKSEMVAPMAGAMKASLERRGIDVYEGRGRFVGHDTVQVGEVVLKGTQIVIAAGSRPRPLTFPGAELLTTSAGFLDMADVPDSVVFVGAGVIAFEFAHVLARLGTKVTLLEVGERPLGRLDADLVAQLVAHSERLRIEVLTGVRVESVSDDGKLQVTFHHDDATHIRSVDRVIHGAGRVSNLDQLDVEAAGIALERGRIALTDHLQSADNPVVWVAGDALPGTPQLSPVATYEGRLVGHNLLNPDDRKTPDYTATPSAVFTIPTLATVGLTAQAARDAGIPVVVRKTDMAGWISSRSYAESVAWAKIVVDEGTGKVVGAHLLGHGAGEVIHLFALAIRYGIPAEELRTGIYAYPTMTNDAKYLV